MPEVVLTHVSLPGSKCWAWPYEIPLNEKFFLLSKAENRKTGKLNTKS